MALHFGDGGVDDAEDADIVLHEYGHSIQDNQVPGYGPGSTPSSGRSARGSATSSPGCTTSNRGNATYQSTRRYCVGDWDAVSYNPFSGANNGSGCLRWIDGTNEGTGADIGTYGGTPVRGAQRRPLLVGGDDLHLRGPRRQRRRPATNVIRLVIAHNALLVPTASNNAFEDSVAALRTAAEHLGGAHIGLINGCAFDRRLITTLPGDTTPPQVQAVVNPATPDGANGFYRGDVGVTWQVATARAR